MIGMHETQIEKVAVIGAGTMGHGIAQVAAQSDYRVTLTDLDPQALERAQRKIAANLDKGVARGKLSEEHRAKTLANISISSNSSEALSGSGLVIEAVSESLALKQKIFSAAEALVAPTTILASNTSSLSLAAIAESLEHPQRLIGMHFFNPVHIMQLLEIVVHDRVSPACREAALAVARRMGKEPIVVKDSPGFASSRLGVVLGLEAMRMLEQGVADAAAIDTAMELGYKHPMGPLKLTDHVGLDVRLAIAEHLHRELGGDQYAPPQILRDKVARNELGRKTKKGFYDYGDAE